MVDPTVAATKVAAIRDAVGRIRATLPPRAEDFEADRTARDDLLAFGDVVAREITGD